MENTINNNENVYVELPVEYRDVVCPRCGHGNLAGVIMTKDADYEDPDIICMDCCMIIDGN